MRKYIFVLFISLLSFNAFAQSKSNYSLLWRISGNGLTKPSYLFGTMHVKDKRVFNFSDSVMLSLQNCQQFAMEVHPDTVIKELYKLMANNDTLRNIDKLLSKQEYDDLSKKFKKKYGYPMGKNPLQVESLMEKNDKPGDKQSFIDAYLYGIARTLNKKIYGLENASAQVNEFYGSKNYVKGRLLELLDDAGESSKDDSKEAMVKIYSTGDLDAIYKYARDNDVIDSDIVMRNKVMAASMVRLMVNSPLFTAIGAAHLPGPDGVIALLRKAGYNVVNVRAEFTGVSNKYKIDYMKMNWNVYPYENVGCSISFPGAPVTTAVSSIQNSIYADLTNEIYYGLYVSREGTETDPAKWESVLQTAKANLTLNKKSIIISTKNIIYNKMPAAEILSKNAGGYMRTRLILANNFLYNIFIGSADNNLDEQYINRFLNSFTLIPIVKKAPAQWINFTEDDGAFSVYFPSQPQKVVKDVALKPNQLFKLNLFVSVDSANYNSYLVRYNNYPDGFILKDKEAVFNSLIDDFKGKVEISKPVKIWQDGFEGREVKAVLTGGYNTILKIFARGNRMYLLMEQATKNEIEKADSGDPFFDSFKLLPYEEPDYYNYTSDSGNFKVQFVSKPRIKPDSTDDSKSFLKHSVISLATDPKSGAVYDLEYSKISPYYRVSSLDSLYHSLENDFTHYTDSTLKKDSAIVAGVMTHEDIILNKETHSEKRRRFIINGDDLYLLVCYGDSTSLFSKTTNTVFNSLAFLHPVAPVVYPMASKAEKIYNDLQSPDTTVYKQALGALSYYDFKKEELPYIYKAIQRGYPDDTSENGVRQKLLKKLRYVNNDSTVTVLSTLYVTLKNKDDLKGTILSEIPDIDKKNGYDTYIKLLTTQPPLNVTESYATFAPLVDSVEYAAAHFKEILPLVKNDSLRSGVLRVAKNIAFDKKVEYNKMIAANYEQIMAFAGKDAAGYIKSKDNYNSNFSGSMYSYMQLAGKVKNAAVNDRFTAFYIKNDPDGVYSPDAIAARVHNNLPNNPVLVNKFLDSMGTRYNLIEAYNDAKLLNRVPLKYRSRPEFAKLCLYQEITDDEDDDDMGAPEKLTLLGSVTYKGLVYYVFDFMQPEREEGKKFIGIAGPYKPGATKLDFSKYYAYTEYAKVNANWRRQAQVLIKPLLDNYKK